MERLIKPTAKPAARPFSSRAAARRGKLTLVTCVAILGMAVLIGFVGNAGYVVTTKINSQNAADSIAFSSAQWMARGMNAVTATNHLLGELTGLVVVLEGLGGPEVDLDLSDYPPQSRIVDEVNRTLADMAYIQGLKTYGTDITGQVDKKFLKIVVMDLISKKDRKHEAFATIYDSKLVLKRQVRTRLLAKFFANWLLWVPPPWGYASAIVGYGIHVGANIQLVEIGIEFIVLHGLEKLVSNDALKKLKVDLIEDKLIPAVAAHGDYLAGRPSKKLQQNPTTESGVVNHAIRQSRDHLQKIYQVEAVIFPVVESFPGIANLRLPIEPESPPSGKGTRAGKEEPEWGDDSLATKDEDNQLDKVFKEIEDKKKKIRNHITSVEKQVEALRELVREVEDLKTRTDVTDQEIIAFDGEIKELDDDIKIKLAKIEELNKDLKKLEAQEKEMLDTMENLAKVPKESGNLSIEKKHLALAIMNQAEERNTQWVRASYPYVDGFRAPILKLFEEHLERSGAKDHYIKWTNRYTLTKAWKFRSGYRFKRIGSSNKGEWRKNRSDKPLQMYLMVEKFDAKNPPPLRRPGAPRGPKGEEIWTKDTTAGKEMAEEMFTLIAITQREIEPFFSPVIFPVASKNGMTTFAQAIYYNGNEQQQTAPAKGSKVQPKVAWDTLNWAPSASPPEWGAKATIADEVKWPWEIFTASEHFKGKSDVRLNWQAKLMPVTSRRFTQTAPAVAKTLDTELIENVGTAIAIFDTMVTH
jgi:hypothetical protein